MGWLYHVSVHPLAERLIGHIRRQELLRAGDRVGVAVSGGIDSVALLHLLLELRHELGIVLSVAHYNHRLRGAESDADLEFVANLADQHNLEFHAASGDVARHAAEQHLGIESAARELRYGFLRGLLSESRETGVTLDKVATAHTLDDQAETVLMRLIRGTGVGGLGGIYPRIPVEDQEGTSGEIIRPLLEIRRPQLEQYLRDCKQVWREDATNPDTKFTRNRIRQRVLPLLERDFNPAVAENLAELADVVRGEQDYWENEISGWLGTTVQWSEPEWAQGHPLGSPESSLVQIAAVKSDRQRRREEPGPLVMNASVSRAWLLSEPLAVQRRLVKAVGDHTGIPLEFKHVQDILRFAAEDGPSGKALALPWGWTVVREPDSLHFLGPDPCRQERIAPGYEYELPLPGRVSVPEVGTVIEAVHVPSESETTGYNHEHLLDPELLPGPLRARNWRPGDRFWPAHTKSPKKIKELLQQRHVTGAARKLWPVVASGDEIVWVRGFPVAVGLKAKPGRDAVLIREIDSEADSGS